MYYAIGENPSSGSCVFYPGGSVGRRTDGQTDMKKLIVTFRSFSEAPKKGRDLKWLFVTCKWVDQWMNRAIHVVLRGSL
jgi:hypothetical protein